MGYLKKVVFGTFLKHTVQKYCFNFFYLCIILKIVSEKISPLTSSLHFKQQFFWSCFVPNNWLISVSSSRFSSWIFELTSVANKNVINFKNSYLKTRPHLLPQITHFHRNHKEWNTPNKNIILNQLIQHSKLKKKNKHEVLS